MDQKIRNDKVHKKSLYLIKTILPMELLSILPLMMGKKLFARLTFRDSLNLPFFTHPLNNNSFSGTLGAHDSPLTGLVTFHKL